MDRDAEQGESGAAGGGDGARLAGCGSASVEKKSIQLFDIDNPINFRWNSIQGLISHREKEVAMKLKFSLLLPALLTILLNTSAAAESSGRSRHFH